MRLLDRVEWIPLVLATNKARGVQKVKRKDALAAFAGVGFPVAVAGGWRDVMSAPHGVDSAII
jgi:hypothetical protein